MIAFLPPLTLPQHNKLVSGELHRLDLLFFFQIYFIFKKCKFSDFFPAVTTMYVYRSKDKEAGGYREENRPLT